MAANTSADQAAVGGIKGANYYHAFVDGTAACGECPVGPLPMSIPHGSPADGMAWPVAAQYQVGMSLPCNSCAQVHPERREPLWNLHRELHVFHRTVICSADRRPEWPGHRMPSRQFKPRPQYPPVPTCPAGYGSAPGALTSLGAALNLPATHVSFPPPCCVLQF